MTIPRPKPPIRPLQANAFQRFTIRLVDGKFVRVPKSDLPSVEARVDKTLTSNQTEMHDLFRVVNIPSSNFQPDAPTPSICPEIPLPTQQYPDPTFDLPE